MLNHPFVSQISKCNEIKHSSCNSCISFELKGFDEMASTSLTFIPSDHAQQEIKRLEKLSRSHLEHSCGIEVRHLKALLTMAVTIGMIFRPALLDKEDPSEK